MDYTPQTYFFPMKPVVPEISANNLLSFKMLPIYLLEIYTLVYLKVYILLTFKTILLDI